jgi:transcriptional regulator with XRE-family HTH domain
MGLTQVELSRALNISQGTLSGYETGRFEPDVDTMQRLADFFHESLDSLFGVQRAPDIQADISEIDFALSGEIRDLSEAEKQDVLDYVRFKRAQRAK